MRAVLDSSALARLYVDQLGAAQVKAVLASTDRLGLCVLCGPEVISALCRLRREGQLANEEYELARAAVAEDLRDSERLDLTPEVLAVCVGLLEASVLRASDALHVACAIEWQADLFVTGDLRQERAARGAGLSTTLVG